MRWVVLVFIASCYSPSPYSNCGVTCATSVDCPTGQSCFDNRCSAQAGQCGIDAPPLDAEIDADLDPDNDGIPNSTDKCPSVMSQDNRDHDNDGLGDICDPCPMFTNNTNSDTDAIGDMCDPRPTNGADVAVFYGFYDASEYTAWQKVGTWSFANGKLIGTNLTEVAGYFQNPATFAGNVAVFADTQIVQISSDTTSDRYTGVSARRSGANFEACHFGVSPGGANLRVRRVNGTLVDNSTPYTGNLTVGTHPMRYFGLGGTVNCNVETQTVAGGGGSAAGKAAVDAAMMNTATEYMFVVTMN